MQSQIVLLLFALNFTQILMQNNNSLKNTVRKYQTYSDNEDYYMNDAPSPEWIRYQQERFQHVSQQQSVKEEPNQKTKPQTKIMGNNERKGKPEESTARHENNYQQTADTENEEGFKENKSKKETENINNENPGNTLELPSIRGFIEFIKSIKQTWMKNSLLRIDDKIKILQRLKDSLLKTIEKQFRILWQDDDDENENENDNEYDNENGDNELEIANAEARNIQHSTFNGHHLRNKRGILDESSINFPPEAALMSINFLTFSVFLIKLVLQVVNIIKSKHYQLSTISMDMNAIRNG